MMGPRYWLIQCRTKREARGREWLSGLGFDVLAPHETRWRKPNRYKRRERIAFQVAVLPSYLIVGMGGGLPAWSRVMVERERDPTGPTAWLGLRPVVFEGGPVRVHPEDVERLRNLEASGRLMAPDHHRHQHRRREYEEGDAVEVIEGPLTGIVARVASIEGRTVRLEFTVLGREIEIDAQALVKAEA